MNDNIMMWFIPLMVIAFVIVMHEASKDDVKETTPSEEVISD